VNEEFTPKIVGFLCNWCSYNAADLAGAAKLEIPSCLTAIKVTCSGRVDPVLVATTLLHGADGVLVAGCHPGDCHYREGNYYARRRFALLKSTLETLGLESDRAMLAWISASEGRRFHEVTSEFVERIKKMGPNLVRSSIPA